MKLTEIRLIREPDRSFITYHELKPFSPWHYHPEYELVYILKGSGRRLVGDHIENFKKRDLVFMGSYLPHEWSCKEKYFEGDSFSGEAIVIQFLYDFLGETFMNVPENRNLKNFLNVSSQGCKFYGNTKATVIERLDCILALNNSERLYSLLEIFRIFSVTNEYETLASPGFADKFKHHEEDPLTKAMQYILTNFQKEVKIHDLLEITHMSNTTFCLMFKKMFRMSFKEYLLKVRTGYACQLLMEDVLSIAEIAYESGFQNISNFNRQFKRIKGITPKEFKQSAI